MSRRFFDPQPFSEGVPVELGEGPSHHIGRVLRIAPGEELVVFNGLGGEWRARVEQVGKRTVTVVPLGFDPTNRTPARAVSLGLPLIKGERMDYAIQKAIECGVSAIRLVQCERSEVRLDGARVRRKLEHLRQVARSACEQCGMNLVPEVSGVHGFADFLSQSRGLRLLAQPGADAFHLADIRGSGPVSALTGPEGGFSESEVHQAAEAGFARFAFGERVLRAETAPVVLLTLLQAAAG